MATTYTFWTIIDRVYETMGIQSDTENCPLDTVEREINDLVAKVINGRVVSLIEKDPFGNDKVYAAGDLSFRRKKKFYNFIQTTTLGDDITTSSTSITCSTTDLPSAWAIFLWWEAITYTAKTSTELTWISTPLVSHTSWDTIYPLYAMPSDITRPYTFWRIDAQSNLQELPPDDNRFWPSYHSFFSVVTSNSNVNYLLLRGYNWEIQTNLQLTYYATPTAMTVDSDICIIPDEYCSLVRNIVAGTLNMRLGEPNDAATQLKSWYAVLNEMYWYFNTTTAKPHARIRQTPIRSIRAYGARTRNR